MSPDEPELTFEGVLAEVADTFTRLDLWGAAVKGLPEIEKGSPLAQDAAIFPWQSTDNLAWQALSAAQDHLKGFRVWLLNRDLFPTATFSLLRGALVGGALATWILFPEDSEARVSRGLVAAEDWYSNHIRWGETMAAYALDAERHADQLKHLEDRREQVRVLRTGRKPNWSRLNMTGVIVEANAELWPHDKGRADQTKALWQAGSGDAHALGWPLLSRRTVMTPVGEGMGKFVAEPSDKDVADAYLCAYDFVAYGFHRLEELRKSS